MRRRAFHRWASVLFNRKPWHIAGDQHSPLQLIELDGALSDQRRYPGSHHGAHLLRHFVGLQFLNESVDDDYSQGAAIFELLLRHGDSHENIAGLRVGLLKLIREREDFGDGDSFSFDGLLKGARFRFRTRENSLRWSNA